MSWSPGELLQSKGRGAPRTCHPITRPARGTCLVLPNACWVVQNSGLSSRTIKKRNTRWLLENHSQGGSWKGPWMLKVFSGSLWYCLQKWGLGKQERRRCAAPELASHLPQETEQAVLLSQAKSPGDLAVLSSVLRFGNLLTVLQHYCKECEQHSDFHNHFPQD